MTLTASNAADRVRVLLVVPCLATGGSERIAFSLLKYLDREIFDVSLVSLYPYAGLPYEREAADCGLSVYYLSKRLGFDWRSFFELDRLFRRLQPHVVQNHQYHLYLALPACIRNRIPVCLHRFNSIAEKEFASRSRRLVYSAAFRYFGVQPVAISEKVRQSAQQLWGPIDMPVVFSGVDVRLFTPTLESREQWRTHNEIHLNAVAFVNVARFCPPKNHALLIRAFAEVVRYFPDALLLLAGDGPLLEATQGLVKQLGLQERVRFLGVREDVAAVLNAADAFVLSSDWEGVPVSVLEAMAAGKPIIATAVGGVPEIVEQDGNGFLVPAGNCEQLARAMLTLCRDKTMVQRLGERGREIAVERFDVRQMARRYGDLYLRLLQQHHRGHR